MMAAWGFLWVLTVAMLTQDVCSYPVKKDFEPGSSYGSGHYTNSAPATPIFIQYSPEALIPGVASSGGVSKSTYQAVPQKEPGYQTEPATSYSSSSFSRPESGNEDGSRGPLKNPQMSDLTQPSAPFQPDYLPDLPWSVEPSLFRSTEETRFGSSETAPEPPVPGYVSPPVPERLIPPPSGPEFQPGEMSHFEKRFEHGNYQRETEEQGYQPPPPPGIPASAELEGLTSEPHPRRRPFRFGRRYPYDFMFLTGQYPPGTVTHFSSSYEHGRDHWQDAHYERIHEPFTANVEELYPSDFSDPHSYQQQPQEEVPSYQPYSKGVDEVGLTTDEGTVSVPYYGGYSQPNLSDQFPDVSSQTSGYNMGKVGGY